jgi:hypothetical protein
MKNEYAGTPGQIAGTNPGRREMQPMPTKISAADLAQKYAAIAEALPGMKISPGNWGLEALEFLAFMAKAGPLFKLSAARILEQDLKLYRTTEARGVGAGWHDNFAGERWISIDKSFGFVDSVIALGHEAHHLQQTIRVRCSVEGEYSAWRLGYRLRAELTSDGVAPLTEDERRLAAMPEAPTRADLKAAQALMHKMAGPNYLIHRAPLQGSDWSTAAIVPFVKLINSVFDRGEQL